MTEQQQQPQQVIIAPPDNATMFGSVNRTIGALSGSPILLVMILLNCAFISAGAYYFRVQQTNVYALVDKVFDRCLPTVHSDVYPVVPGTALQHFSPQRPSEAPAPP